MSGDIDIPQTNVGVRGIKPIGSWESDSYENSSN